VLRRWQPTSSCAKLLRVNVSEESILDIPGWFYPDDVFLFNWLLRDQARHGVSGDLLEIGVYHGKSAVVVGAHLRPGEKFTVVDLFETAPDDQANLEENLDQYGGLVRAAFERNYRRFHGALPDVVQGHSSSVRDHVSPHTVRFLHVDGSHLYEHVRADAEAAQLLLAEDGVVVFDDFRAEHTPGTAAAVWEAVTTAGLKPFALTEHKLYGTWGDATSLRHRLGQALEGEAVRGHETQSIAGHEVLRIYATPVPRPFRVRVRSRITRMVRRANRALRT
jgi:hypothetical protein